jgi:hypothetical protein
MWHREVRQRDKTPSGSNHHAKQDGENAGQEYAIDGPGAPDRRNWSAESGQRVQVHEICSDRRPQGSSDPTMLAEAIVLARTHPAKLVLMHIVEGAGRQWHGLCISRPPGGVPRRPEDLSAARNALVFFMSSTDMNQSVDHTTIGERQSPRSQDDVDHAVTASTESRPTSNGDLTPRQIRWMGRLLVVLVVLCLILAAWVWAGILHGLP